MSKARQLADLGNQIDDGAITGTNMVINGAMTVAQRSTSETGLANGTNSYKTVDRYTTYISGLGAWTQSQDTDAPDGFGHSLKMLCTTADASPAAGDRMLIQTKIEGQDVQSLGFGNTANTYTVSFYVKSNVTGTYILEQYGDSASATGNNISTAYTINAANTWERKTITLNVDSGAMTADNTSGLVLSFWLGSGTNYTSGTLNTSWSNPASTDRAVGQVNLASATNNYWQITGVCLNVGDSAIDFPHESYGDTLAKCQRYTYIISGAGYTPATSSAYDRYVMFGTGPTTAKWITPFPTTMRAVPSLITSNFTSSTVQIYSYTDDASKTLSSIALAQGGTNQQQVDFTLSGSGFADTITWRWNNSPAAYIGFDAEL